MDDTIENNKEYFNDTSLNYSSMSGLSIYNMCMFTPYLNSCAEVLFSIFEKYNIEYILFAGSSVGYLRDKRQMYWTDDFDIIVLPPHDEAIIKLKDILLKNGFKCVRVKYGILIKEIRALIDKKKRFQIDVFVSFFNKKNNLCNIARIGLYHKKLPNHVLYPYKYIIHSGIKVKCPNDIEEETRLCYGDINKGVLYSHFAKTRIKTGDWKTLDAFFKDKIENGINNVKEQISGHDYITIININEDIFTDYIDILKYISHKKAKQVNIFNISVLEKYVYDIKFYFAEIAIHYYCIDLYISPVFLRMCDVVYVANQTILEYYQSSDIMYIDKTRFELTRVITFGTFDVYHEGHKNIFNVCELYSNNISVGLSTDEFTYKKKQISCFDTYETRSTNIKKHCKYVNKIFKEESMELKKEYIQNEGSNLLIMGDDWKSAFDEVGCAVLYVPRTPCISSTMIREIYSNENMYNHKKDRALVNYSFEYKHRVPLDFNIELYKKLNIDLLNMDDTDALCHYIEHGNK